MSLSLSHLYLVFNYKWGGKLTQIYKYWTPVADHGPKGIVVFVGILLQIQLYYWIHATGLRYSLYYETYL